MRVWVTREEDHNGPLSTALRAAGLIAVLEPVIGRRVVQDVAAVVGQLESDDWLVLTSPYAIRVVPVEPARVPRVAVVGEPSRRAAEARGLRVELVSSGGDAKSLFEELRTVVTGGKVCYPRSSQARLPDGWPGVELISPVLYETCRRDFDPGVIKRVDVVSVVSPSAVETVGVLDMPYVSIGPSTSAALRKMGVEPWIEAPERSFESLAQAIAAQAGPSRHHRA